MDWSSLAGQLAQIGLPALGGLFGGPLGSTIGGVVGKAIAGALGVQPTPQAVSQAIQADPSGAAVRLAEIEAETKAREAEFADLANARQMEIVAIQADHGVAWVPVAITVMNYALVVGLIAGVAMGWIREDGIIAGWILGAATAGYNFWIGTSESSRRKDATLQRVATSAVTPSPGAVAAQVAKAVRR